MDIQAIHQAIINHPNQVLLGTTCALALLALAPTRSAIPLVLLIATQQIFLRLSREHWVTRSLFSLLALSVSIAIAHVSPSLQALSTPGESLFASFFLSLCSSIVALSAIALDVKIRSRVKTSWAQLTVFPLIWASWWSAISYSSPLGRLVTWSPTVGLSGYDWMTPFMGPIIKDWLVGAWAVILSEIVGQWYIGEDPSSHDLLVDVDASPPQASRHTLVLTSVLAALLLPSFVVSDLPASLSLTHTTPLVVGCVLPTTPRARKTSPILEDYLYESKQHTEAHILLWPESAISFNSPEERDAGFAKIRENVRGPYIGVSFEEFIPLDPDNHARQKIKRTGVALISNHSTEVHLSYYKRALVPIAESFALAPSSAPPSLYTMDLGAPKGTNKTDWALPPNYTRPISVTASICLDFAQPAPFRDLDARPSLILAPARTWHTAVGAAMWEQAKARAEELDSTVLWCDGGEGGVSGVAGGRLHEVMQVGPGTWTRKVGIEWPFDERRTVYAASGDGAALTALLGVLGFGWVAEAGAGELLGPAFAWVARRVKGTQEAIRDRRKWRVIAPPHESTSLLG